MTVGTTAIATIIHVPADHSTIQAGIGAASEGDTVLVQYGGYPELLDFGGKAIRVSGTAPDDPLVVARLVPRRSAFRYGRPWRSSESELAVRGHDPEPSPHPTHALPITPQPTPIAGSVKRSHGAGLASKGGDQPRSARSPNPLPSVMADSLGLHRQGSWGTVLRRVVVPAAAPKIRASLSDGRSLYEYVEKNCAYLPPHADRTHRVPRGLRSARASRAGPRLG